MSHERGVLITTGNEPALGAAVTQTAGAGLASWFRRTDEPWRGAAWRVVAWRGAGSRRTLMTVSPPPAISPISSCPSLNIDNDER